MPSHNPPSPKVSKGEVEKPLPSPGKVTSDGNTSPKPTDPLATVGEVFSFMPNVKTKIYFCLGIFFASLSGCVFPAMAFLFSSSFEDLSGSTSESSYLATIRELAYSFMILGVVALILMTLQATLLEIVALEMTNNFKTKWFRALLRQDMAYYDLRDISGAATLISSNAIRFKKGVGKKLGDGVQFFFTLILGMVYGFWSSWQIALLVLAVVPFMALSATYLMKLVTTQTQRANSSYAKAGSIVYTTVSSIRTILSLNAVESMVAKFLSATKDAYDGATKQVMQLGLANGCIFASFLLVYLPVTLYGAYLLYRDVRENGCDPSGSSIENPVCEPVSGIGVFGAMFGVSFAGSVLPQVSSTIEAFTGAQSAAYPALEAIYRDTTHDKDKEAEMDEMSQSLQRRGSSVPLPKYTIDSFSPLGEKLDIVKGDIEFHDVRFAYPSRLEVDVFQGLSLKVPAGKTVALVGTSGGGKSTTVHLLERFYDVKSGSITLDGVDIRHLNIKWLREQIGLVSQEPKLFAQSIRQNIAIGLPGATQEQIEEAARKANAHDFITSFPSGYDTQVGDEGAQLSGGQKQRIAIARVLIKKPKILLLDEATSALDSESEAVVQEALDVLMQEGNQTVIVIAHRLSTVRNADMIAVISDGRVVETGSHDELMAKNGAYAELVNSQNRNGKKDEATAATSSASSQTSSNPTSRSSSFVEESSEIITQDAVQGVEVEVGDIVPVLRFRDVHFHYPSRPKNKILRGLDLAVREGETLAIVGPSGRGKSTLIQLIEAFYRPTKGSVEFQGVNMEDLNVRWVRDQLSLVSQEPVLFDTTICENIKFGNPAASQSDVEWAAREANAHDFIMRFPDGYETQCGAGSSIQVSGGQKQRIAIARALLRKPKVLLLDEATSALDSESESVVQEALDKIMADMTQTTIVIAHRLSTIRNADRIAVIDHGKVRELGTHDELMAKPRGKFRRLHDLQNLNITTSTAGEEGMKQGYDDDEHRDGDHIAHSEDPVEHISKDEERKYAQRARLMAKGDSYLLMIGAFGALIAGLMFPGWGFIFAFMVKVLYYRVDECDDARVPPVLFYPEFENCQDYWDDAADYMRDLSFNVSYGLLSLMATAMVGNVLMFWGFGTASERMNKRVRDAAFSNLIRQEVSYFDVRPIGVITTQLSDDAALIHAFTGQPIRMMVMNLASVFVGIIVAFLYMWPFALMALGLLPFMSIGKALEMQTYMGDDSAGKDSEDLPPNSAGGIMVESLLNIRTVASLTIEEERINEYEAALSKEDPCPLRQIIIKGSTGGISMFVQLWGIGLMNWFGGWLLFRFPDDYVFQDMLISMFGLMFGMTGIGIAMADLADTEKTKAAAKRIFDLIDRESLIDPLSESGKKLN